MAQMGKEIEPTAHRSAHVLDLRRPLPPPPARPPKFPVPDFHETIAAIAPVVLPRAGHPRTRSRPKRPSRRTAQRPVRRLTVWRVLGELLRAAIVLAAAAGLLMLNISLAQRLMAIYLVVAVFYAISSQRTFLVALGFLVMVTVWSVLDNTVTAADYATYAFDFLAIGLISAVREMLAAKRRTANRH